VFSNAALERNKAIAQNWIDQLFNASLMAFVGCSMAAVLAIGGPTSAGDAQVTIPMSERLLDQHVFRASYHEPLTQQLFRPTNAPVGQGWG
jgi:hypothetical protein